MIIKEYRCKAHGNFESSDENPVCPYGCDVVDRVFMTPPGFRSDATRRMDSNTEMLAKSYGLTDMNNRGGRPVIGQDPNMARRQEEFNHFIKQRYGDGWGNVPKGGTYNVQERRVEGTGSGAMGALSQYHATPDNVVGNLKDSGAFTPKPVHMIRDHENLKVDLGTAA